MKVSLEDAFARALEELAVLQGITQEEALKRAIADELYLKRSAMLKNRTFMFLEAGEMREVALPESPWQFLIEKEEPDEVS